MFAYNHFYKNIWNFLNCISSHFEVVIKGTKIVAETKECNPGTKTRHGKQTNTTKNTNSKVFVVILILFDINNDLTNVWSFASKQVFVHVMKVLVEMTVLWTCGKILNCMVFLKNLFVTSLNGPVPTYLYFLRSSSNLIQSCV